ncbi:MAG TPA: hypothetical protein VF103_05255, partial [Polyangiaceae bacterium]
DPVCDTSKNCKARYLNWRFTVSADPKLAKGDTRPPPIPERIEALAAAPASADEEVAHYGGVFVLLVGGGILLAYGIALGRRDNAAPKLEPTSGGE